MNFNTPSFAAIIKTARAKAARSPRWLRAVEKAAAALINGDLIVTNLHNGALVTSANGTYRVNGHCACAAAKHGDDVCYHRAAARLVEMYETAPEPTAPKPQPTKPAPGSPRITRSIERNRAGVKLTVTRCDGWMI